MWREGRLADYLPTWADVLWWLQDGQPAMNRVDVNVHHRLMRR